MNLAKESFLCLTDQEHRLGADTPAAPADAVNEGELSRI